MQFARCFSDLGSEIDRIRERVGTENRSSVRGSEFAMVVAMICAGLLMLIGVEGGAGEVSLANNKHLAFQLRCISCPEFQVGLALTLNMPSTACVCVCAVHVCACVRVRVCICGTCVFVRACMYACGRVRVILYLCVRVRVYALCVCVVRMLVCVACVRLCVCVCVVYVSVC